jgi:hypothetical protein
MNWEAIGAIGEVSGAVAVVVTLIYLAKQIQHSASASRSEAHQRAAQSLREVVLELAKPETAELWLRASDYDSLSPVERLRVGAILTGIFTNFETSFYEHQRGTLEPEVWDARVNRIRALLRDRPAAHVVWRNVQQDLTFGKSFAEFVNREINNRHRS